VWDEVPPEWPDEDDEVSRHGFEDDEPTERMPAYQEVLSQWFQTSEQWSALQPGPAAPEWPVEEDPDRPHGLNGTAPADPPTLRLDPADVHLRMTRLQDGVARARGGVRSDG
jgi:hypothetical protein